MSRFLGCSLEPCTSESIKSESNHCGQTIKHDNGPQQCSEHPGEELPKQSVNKILPHCLSQALELPVVVNLNPRSVYNKSKEFHEFVEQEEADLILMSESWERPDYPLNEIIKLENHTVISNPHQSKGKGGRPAIIADNSKFNVRNLTNILIDIPWGVEACWALLTPNITSNNSKIKKFAVCSLYSKPKS